MKATYSQIAASVIALVLIVFLGIVFFFPSRGTDQQVIIVAIIPALSLCLNFLLGTSASSQAKDANIAATTSTLISSLQSSQPAEAKKN